MSKNDISITESVLPDFNSAKARNHRNKRHINDVITRYLMSFGGVSVIIAIVLIAFYLFYVVFPMFMPAKVKEFGNYAVPGDVQQRTIYFHYGRAARDCYSCYR